MLHGNSTDCKAYCSRCVAVPQTAYHSYCVTVQWTTRFNIHAVSTQSFNEWPFLGLQSLPFMLRGSSMHCKASSVLSQALRPCRRFSQNNCNTAMSTSRVLKIYSMGWTPLQATDTVIIYSLFKLSLARMLQQK